MNSERIQRRIDQMLDQIDEAAANLDWGRVRELADGILRLDPENADARAYLAAADRDTSVVGTAPPAPAVSEPTPQPTSFANGRYTVTKFLGEGGKKKVYLAHDAQLDRDVAFALIKTEGLDEAARIRVTREAQAMGRLGSHPHIVTVYDIGEQDGQPYLVLPVLPGGDVEGVIEKAPDHKLSIEQAVKIGVETCLGLEFSHSKGIIHRDLKPGNVWLAEDGRAMIGDFGLAVAVDRSRLTQAGMMVGTVNYMPPEQAMGGEVTPQSDLYSLGAMLYEMVCGRPPFVGDESVAIIGQHLNTPPVAPSWHRPDCPSGLEALILRLLEKDATKRPGSAAEVREALLAVSQSGNQSDVGAGLAPAQAVPTQATVDPLYRRTFVGRENETRQLHQAYDAAVSGQGGLVMVVGEPGIGKTAICEQLATYVQLRGGKTLVGHCYEEGSLSLPYLAFVEAMRSYVLTRDPESLRSELGTGAAEVARIVSEVRDRVHVELRDASDPEDDRWRLLNAISTFLRNAAQVQPLVIVLEDLHWADRGTLDLLLHVARNLDGARLLIVGTYRDVEVDRQHPLSATLADLRRINTFLRVPLRGLTVDEVHRMYEAIRGNEVPWGQAEAVHRATEGNPLFVQEVLRYLVEEGIIVREGGTYAVRGDATAIPDGLRDVVGRRLSHLSDKTNQVLSVASVIGREFRLDVLQHVTGMPEETVLQALEEASERSIIEQRPAAGSVGFRFTHAFFRQVLYEEIFAPRRIRWHQQVGRALEDVHIRRLEEHASELSEHFSQSTEARDLEKAVRYGQLAAQRAMNVFAYGEAVRHLEQALRAQEVLDSEDVVTRCDLLLALAEPLSAIGDAPRVREEIFPMAFELAETIGDGTRAYTAASRALDITLPQLSRARPWLEAAERHAGNEPRRRIRLARAWATIHMLEGRNNLSTPLLREALHQARLLADANLEFGALWGFLALTTAPDEEKLGLADEYFLRDRSGTSVGELSMALQVIAHFYLLSGARQKADALAAELKDLASRSQHSTAKHRSAVLERNLAAMDGDLPSDVTASGTPWWVWDMEIAAWIGAAPISPVLSGEDSLDDNVRAALFAARNGHHGDAKRALSAAIASLTPEVASFHLLELLETAVLVSDRSSAEHVLGLVHGSSPGGFNTRSGSPYRRRIANACLFIGRAEEARAYYQENVSVCETIGHRPELALSRLGLAELLLDHYPDEHDAAIEHLDFAIAELREMKMQPALERALGRRGLLKA